MEDESGGISLNGQQVRYIMFLTQIEDPDAAIETFMQAMVDEKVSPKEICTYVDLMLKKRVGFKK